MFDWRKNNYWKPVLGKHWKHTAEYKKKLSLARMGKNNPVYVDGSSVKRRAKTQRMKNWRLAVFKRDDYRCQECGQRGGTLNAHHIQLWSERPAERFKIRNGVTLCLNCHKYVHRFEREFRKTIIRNETIIS